MDVDARLDGEYAKAVSDFRPSARKGNALARADIEQSARYIGSPLRYCCCLLRFVINGIGPGRGCEVQSSIRGSNSHGYRRGGGRDCPHGPRRCKPVEIRLAARSACCPPVPDGKELRLGVVVRVKNPMEFTPPERQYASGMRDEPRGEGRGAAPACEEADRQAVRQRPVWGGCRAKWQDLDNGTAVERAEPDAARRGVAAAFA
jgi:hypothetical protein